MADLNVQRRKLSDDMFVGQTRNLIEILVATGHQEEAEKIHTNAMSLIDDRRLASAVTDAEKKIAGAAKVAGRSRETEGR
jgi:hypothetical protein